MNIFFFIEVKILIIPPIRSTIEPRMVSEFWVHNPISFRHMMPFWCQFLDPHLTTYHSNVGQQIIVVINLGMST